MIISSSDTIVQAPWIPDIDTINEDDDNNLLEALNNYYRSRIPVSSIHEDAEGTPFKDKHLTVKLLDVEDFVKKNDVKEITNPMFFLSPGRPTPDGLLSNEIFGITKDERSNIWGYIDLRGVYLHPLVYKIWSRMDKSIANIVHGLKSYKISSEGYIVEDPNGETGLSFLYKNIAKIKIKQTESKERQNNIEFIMANKKNLFIRKMLVQPPYYRDVLSKGGKVEVGQLNKYYSSLLISARALRETQDLGFSLGEATEGRIQETLLSIYKCVTGTSKVPEDGVGLSGKLGILNTASLGKTVDYATRLVLSAPELKAESLEDIMVDTEYCALPLASAIVNFKPFVVFCVKRFFENEFGGGSSISVINNQGKRIFVKAKDPQSVFSDQNIEAQIKKFVYGFSNRLEAVEVPVEMPDGTVKNAKAVFKGRNITAEQFERGEIEGESSLINRALTWCDVFFMATNEAIKDKCVLITRYPIDSAYNQIPQKAHITTLKETEPVYVYGKFYRWYPKIRQEDIGSNTSNKFIDTLSISNLLIGGMGADYDGDTVSVKGVWLQESNKELESFLKSKSHYISFSGSNIRTPSNEAIQSLYSLTKVLDTDKTKLTDPEF